MSESAFPLEELSHEITDNAKIVSQYLASENLPQPSSRSDGPSTVVPKDSPQSIYEARENLIAKSLELLQLAIGPSEFLPHLATGVRFCPATLRNNFRLIKYIVSIHFMSSLVMSI
jgi:6-hydroxytryprostatin B O-methyltransferase